MTGSHSLPLVAVDVGNARAKLGRFPAVAGDALPEPAATLSVAVEGALEEVAAWLEPAPGVRWWIASVNRPLCTRLLEWLADRRAGERVVLLSSHDLPLSVAVPRPDMVGIDRLLDAVAVNRLRPAGQPAVIVDAGTAITVDAVSADGTFLGGAITPGIGAISRAMHEFTDLLPLVELDERDGPPPPLGTATESALRSGFYWGAVGAVREVITRFAAEGLTDPAVFITGGAGRFLARGLESGTWLPHLTLAGIALTAAHLGTP